METIHKLKDNAYKLIFDEPEMFIEFITSFIPIDILKQVELDDIEDITERFLPLFTDNKDSDTVKKINLPNSSPLFVIGIIEHESEVNYTSSFKMLQYITYVLADYVKENDKRYDEEVKAGHTELRPSTAKDFKLPPVLPIVFYDGTSKWTSCLNFADRTELSDIFSKYVPKFEYELVDLNRYSRDDLTKLGNALSLILIADKVRKATDFELLSTLPEGYMEGLTLNVPDGLLKLLADCMRLFLTKAEVEKEKIDEVTEKIFKRRFVDMFDVQFSFKEIKKEIAKEVANEAANEALTEVAKKLLRKGMVVKDVSESTGLNEEYVEQLETQLEDGHAICRRDFHPHIVNT